MIVLLRLIVIVLNFKQIALHRDQQIHQLRAFIRTQVPPQLGRTPGSSGLRPARSEKGTVVLPLVNRKGWGVLARYEPDKNAVAAFLSYQGEGAQAVAVGPKGKLAYLGHARLRVIALPSGRSRGSLA